MHTPLPANPRLDLLQPYPFERLRALLATPEAARIDTSAPLIDLSIGEPRHPTPAVVLDALAHARQGLSSYPATAGKPALREAIARWISRRYDTPLDPATQILPVNGSREALFAFAQAMLDPAERDAIVISPNPFYQIYEGAALLAGARLHLVDQHPDNSFRIDWSSVPESVWQKTRLVYVCSPGNPTGQVMDIDEWKRLFDLSDRWGFIIAADECYSEIYRDENRPPLGALEAATRLGHNDFRRLVVFSSLSKRSNVPGMRSGFVAGDAHLLKRFLRYRTYHGCAMSPMFQDASIAAWNDEEHVRDNRRLYRRKFDEVVPILSAVQPITMPEASFYLWLPVPGGDDEAFTARLHREHNVLVLPGSYLGRATRDGWAVEPALAADSGSDLTETPKTFSDPAPVVTDDGNDARSTAPGENTTRDSTTRDRENPRGNATLPARNPGQGFVRIALVAPHETCVEGAKRIAGLIKAY